MTVTYTTPCSSMARRLEFRCSPCLSVVFICTASLLNTGCRGMKLTSEGPQTIQSAEGESVTLGCTYVPGPTDTGDLDIEWSVVSPDTTQKDQLLMSYTGGTRYIHSSHALAEGLDFAAGDPSLGDASLSIASLSPAHGSTYQCKVKKSPGVDMRKVSLVVMVKPSVPTCWKEGGDLVGEPISLHCKSAKGSTPLNYVWKREREGAIPPIASQNDVTGELTIRNHSESFVGMYLCEATNAVGAAQCRIRLRASRPPNRAGVIAGTVVGSLLLIILLLIFIGLLVCKLSARPCYEKEMSNEIREDVPAPESRPASRGTSRGASLHPGVAYSQVGTAEQSGFDRQLTHTPSTDSPSCTAVKYDTKYGYAV